MDRDHNHSSNGNGEESGSAAIFAIQEHTAIVHQLVDHVHVMYIRTILRLLPFSCGTDRLTWWQCGCCRRGHKHGPARLGPGDPRSR